MSDVKPCPLKRRPIAGSAAQKRWEYCRRTYRFLVQCACGETWRYEQIWVPDKDRELAGALIEAGPHWYACGKHIDVYLIRTDLNRYGNGGVSSLAAFGDLREIRVDSSLSVWL